MSLWSSVFVPPYDPRTLFQPANTGSLLDVNGQNVLSYQWVEYVQV